MRAIVKNFLLLLLIIPTLSCSKKEEETTPVEDEPETTIEVNCEIINKVSTGVTFDYATELPFLEEVYANFEDYSREKDRESFRTILFYNDLPLFITGKEVSGIVSITLDGAGFENYIIDNPNPHELQISAIEFSVYDGAATSWATYHEVISGDTIGSGIDLFFYLKTPAGWKLATTNNTYVLPGDENDYGVSDPMLEEPSVVLNNMLTAFNSKDTTAFLTNFKDESTLYMLSGSITEAFSSDTHTPEAFANCAFDTTNPITLSVIDVAIEVRDHYLATVVTNYAMEQNGVVTQSGELVMTMIGTPSDGWKISATTLTF